jgi:hypothetical protein
MGVKQKEKDPEGETDIDPRIRRERRSEEFYKTIESGTIAG